MDRPDTLFSTSLFNPLSLSHSFSASCSSRPDMSALALTLTPLLSLPVLSNTLSLAAVCFFFLHRRRRFTFLGDGPRSCGVFGIWGLASLCL